MSENAACKHMSPKASQKLNPGRIYQELPLHYDTLFILDMNNSIIVLQHNGILRCEKCDRAYWYYANKEAAKITVIRNDLTQVPIKIYNIKLSYFIGIITNTIPSFGTFITGTDRSGRNFIIYCISSKIMGMDFPGNTVIIDNKSTACGMTADNEIILMNCDGEIIGNTIIVYSDPDDSHLFKIGNSTLRMLSDCACCKHINWVYNNPAHNTKPALAVQADSIN